jgi:hypothetical protein
MTSWETERGKLMKVDYHLHLEEGPYSIRWLDQTKTH